MHTTQSDHHDQHDLHRRRASTVGAYVATLGALVLLVSVWLDWLTRGPGDSERDPSSGYEGDGVIPFMAYLAVGFALALLYATARADRRQHRGLSLASFAAGIASLLWCLSFLIDPISTTQYGENISIEIGPWIGLVGSLLWTLGSFLLAKEPEGDFEDDHRTVAQPVTTHTETRPVTSRTETHHETRPVAHHTDSTGTIGTGAAGSRATGGSRVTDVNDRGQRPGTSPR